MLTEVLPANTQAFLNLLMNSREACGNLPQAQVIPISVSGQNCIESGVEITAEYDDETPFRRAGAGGV